MLKVKFITREYLILDMRQNKKYSILLRRDKAGKDYADELICLFKTPHKQLNKQISSSKTILLGLRRDFLANRDATMRLNGPKLNLSTKSSPRQG